jgi:hypothetical protein
MAANPKTYFRLHRINRAYLDDLVHEGTYGGTKSEVMRRFVEEGIRRALTDNRIARRNIADYGGPMPSRDE